MLKTPEHQSSKMVSFYPQQLFEGNLVKRQSAHDAQHVPSQLDNDQERKALRLYAKSFKVDVPLEVVNMEEQRTCPKQSPFGAQRPRNFFSVSQPSSPKAESMERQTRMPPILKESPNTNLNIKGVAANKTTNIQKGKQQIWASSRFNSQIVSFNHKSRRISFEKSSGSENSSGRISCSAKSKNQNSDLTTEELKVENQQLTELNRKLVDELEAYRLKDTLKEADYILNHKYNEGLLNFRDQFILRDKQQYLLAFKKQKDQEVNSLKASMEAEEIKRVSVSTETDPFIDVIQTQTQKIKEQSHELTQIQQEIKNVIQSYTDVQSQLQESQTENLRLKAETSEMRKKAKHWEEQAAQIEDQNKNLAIQLSDAQAQKSQMKRQLMEYQKKYQDVDINFLHEQIASLRCENQALKNLINTNSTCKTSSIESSLFASNFDEEELHLKRQSQKDVRRRLKTQVRVLQKRDSQKDDELQEMFLNKDCGIRYDYEERLHRSNVIKIPDF